MMSVINSDSSTLIDYALKHPQIKDDLKQYLIDLVYKLEGKPAKKD